MPRRTIPAPTPEPPAVAAPVCDHPDHDLIPLAALAAEGLAAPIGATLEQHFADQAVTDDLGRVCLPREAAREVLAEHRQRARRQVPAGPVRRPRPTGIAVTAEHVEAGMSAFEVMLAESEAVDPEPKRRVSPLAEHFDQAAANGARVLARVRR